MKKQAAILLQAHWRGKLARRQFVVLVEENRKKRIAEQAKLTEEREALKKEEMIRTEALRREQDEVKKQGDCVERVYTISTWDYTSSQYKGCYNIIIYM